MGRTHRLPQPERGRAPSDRDGLGRAEGSPTTINQLSFRVGSLEDLRRFYAVLVAEGAKEIVPRDHGNAWSIYFSDPEDNRIELYTPSPWYVKQPRGERLDLSEPAEVIRAKTEALIRADPTGSQGGLDGKAPGTSPIVMRAFRFAAAALARLVGFPARRPGLSQAADPIHDRVRAGRQRRYRQPAARPESRRAPGSARHRRAENGASGLLANDVVAKASPMGTRSCSSRAATR